MTAKPKKTGKLPLICRMCKMGLVKYYCKVCPPVSAADLPMSEEDAHALNMQMRIDEEAEGIVSNIVNYNGDKYETSENYTIHGQFTTGELANRARERLFNWDMYVWRLPVSEWLPARDVQATREILENYFPLKTGDTGPAGGIVIKCDTGIRENGYHCVEAAPFDAGWKTWQDALKLCEEISINGIGGWRLPSVEELRDFQAVLRKRLRERNVLQTTETVLNWSGIRRGENALAVVTQENEDFWQYLYHYPMGGTSGGFYRSKDGPRRGDEKELPITHRYPVRPVRDFYAKKIFEEEGNE